MFWYFCFLESCCRFFTVSHIFDSVLHICFCRLGCFEAPTWSWISWPRRPLASCDVSSSAPFSTYKLVCRFSAEYCELSQHNATALKNSEESESPPCCQAESVVNKSFRWVILVFKLLVEWKMLMWWEGIVIFMQQCWHYHAPIVEPLYLYITLLLSGHF